MTSFLQSLKQTIETVDTQSNQIKQIVDDEFKFSKTDVFTQDDMDKVLKAKESIVNLANQVKDLKLAVSSQSFDLNKYQTMVDQLHKKIRKFEIDNELETKYDYKAWVKPSPAQNRPSEENPNASGGPVDSDNGNQESEELTNVQEPVCPQLTPSPPARNLPLPTFAYQANEIADETTCITQPINTALFASMLNNNTGLNSPNMTFARDMSSIKEVTVEFTPGLTTKRPAQPKNDRAKASLFSLLEDDDPTKGDRKNNNYGDENATSHMSWLSHNNTYNKLPSQEAPANTFYAGGPFKAPFPADETPRRPDLRQDLTKSCKKILENTKYAPKDTPEPPKQSIDPNFHRSLLAKRGF